MIITVSVGNTVVFTNIITIINVLMPLSFILLVAEVVTTAVFISSSIEYYGRCYLHHDHLNFFLLILLQLVLSLLFCFYHHDINATSYHMFPLCEHLPHLLRLALHYAVPLPVTVTSCMYYCYDRAAIGLWRRISRRHIHSFWYLIKTFI